IKRGFRLGDRRFQRPKVPNTACAAGGFGNEKVKVHDLREREVAHQAKRRYSSLYFSSTRSAATLKSWSRPERRSATAALASSSGVILRRSASWRSLSARAAVRSMSYFMVPNV